MYLENQRLIEYCPNRDLITLNLRNQSSGYIYYIEESKNCYVYNDMTKKIKESDNETSFVECNSF